MRVAALLLVTASANPQIRTRHSEQHGYLTPLPPLKVVNLDFEAFVDEYEQNALDRKSIDIAIGSHPFRCYLGENDFRIPEARTEELQHFREWLGLSKLAHHLKVCQKFRVGPQAPTYSLCHGQDVYINTKPSETISRERGILIGYASPKDMRIYPNGTMTQLFRDPIQETEAFVKYECAQGPFKFMEARALNNRTHFIRAAAPQFCDWRDGSLDKPALDRLILEDFGTCLNMTGEYWQHEYCHPDSLLQFHVLPNGTLQNPKFLLGSLNLAHIVAPATRQDRIYSPSLIQAKGPKFLSEPSPDFPFLRSISRPTLEDLDSIARLVKNLPVSIEVIPPQLLAGTYGHFWPVPMGTKGLVLSLNEGSKCPEMPSGRRSTRVYFYCPQEMGLSGTMDPLVVIEFRTCEYGLLVSKPSVCAHPQLMPKPPELLSSIQCLRRRSVVPRDLSLDGFDLAIRPEANDRIADWILDGRPITRVKDLKDLGSSILGSLNWLPHSAAWSIARKLLRQGVPPRDMPSYEAETGLSAENLPSSFLLYQAPFATSRIPRDRRSPGQKFKIGDIVVHREFQWAGVVTGWDSLSRTTPDARALYDLMHRVLGARESRQMRAQPWYTVQIEISAGKSRRVYAPQSLLRAATESELTVYSERLKVGGVVPDELGEPAAIDGKIRFTAKEKYLQDVYPLDNVVPAL